MYVLKKFRNTAGIKKSFAVFTAALAVLLTGCSYTDSSDSSQSTVQQSDIQLNVNTSSHLSGNSQNEPKGEPTFLIGADGLPIYTSEITEVTAGEFGYDVIPVDQLDKKTFAQVICDGFAYVHDSRINVLAIEDPDKFDNGVYIGEELPPSAEFRRLRTGDKVGTLTVRSASTTFSRESELTEHGSYLESSSVFFDGEITITGYLSIYENPLYQDGMVSFMPAESTLPQMFYQYADGVGVSHAPVLGNGSYGETAMFNLGYLQGIKADLSGLRVGDTNVKVRAVIGNIRTGGSSMPTYFGELLTVDIL